jgi:hypothetical protein
MIFDSMHSGEVNIATNTTRATKHLHVLDGVLVLPSWIKAVSSQLSMEKYTIWPPGPLPDIYLFWTAAENKFLRPPPTHQKSAKNASQVHNMSILYPRHTRPHF